MNVVHDVLDALATIEEIREYLTADELATLVARALEAEA